MRKKARNSFCFSGCFELREILGKAAWDTRELLEFLEEVPEDSIYYHTHSYFLRHPYIAGFYPNDFAHWAATQVGDKVLAERLAVLLPRDFIDLEGLRNTMLNVLDQHLSRLDLVPRVAYGEAFHFMRSTMRRVDTGLEARDLKTFQEILAGVDLSVIFFHTFEAWFRHGRIEGDFAIWLDEELGLRELRQRIAQLDPYAMSLEGYRKRLLALCDEYRKA